MGRRKNDDALAEAGESAWGMFLDTLICSVGSVGPDESLALIAPTDARGWTPQLVIRRDDDLIWAALSYVDSTVAERVVAQADADYGTFEMAEAIVRVAREEFGLPHPQLLAARSDGPGAAVLAEVLGLAEADEIVEEGSAVDVMFGAPDTLRAALAVVRSVVPDSRARIDDDGDIAFDAPGGHHVWIHLDMPGRKLVLWTCVTRNVHSRRTTAVEVGLLNRDSSVSMWYEHRRAVFQQAFVPVEPFVLPHLEWVLPAFLGQLADTRDDLDYRVGGTAAWG